MWLLWFCQPCIPFLWAIPRTESMKSFYPKRMCHKTHTVCSSLDMLRLCLNGALVCGVEGSSSLWCCSSWLTNWLKSICKYIYISTCVWTSILILFFWNWPPLIIAKLAHKYLTVQEIIVYGCEVQSFVSSANYICHCLQIINKCETNETRDRWTILLQCIWYFDWYLV